ncbi:ABC transporter permease [Sphingomonas nostoxanthinifaciens]|uniref:ABC transporter permease n=1 Tax=Sphingomonas nostoxanthinifaciens TaxID=2872652 RepID=UPI001CC1DB54|nr:FtsX-like permease family protein [Sphingomonas nostoxanthinifaciens]UAK25071.1 FtsX-like permease family protein [Sphingomonas nostoxanthinifaciens]
MSVAWRLALRDLRRGGRGLLLLALCLFLGTGGLAGIGSLSASLIAALDAQGRTMLGGDLDLQVSQRRALVDETAAFAAAGRLSETLSMRAMAQAADRPDVPPVLIELRGVDDRWPLVGRFRLAPGARAPRPHGLQAVVAPALAERMGLRIGDAIRIGSARLTIVGLIADEPDRLGGNFAIGPPVIVDMAALDATRLVQPGSLYTSHYRLLLPRPAEAAAVGARLVGHFPSAGWSVRTPEQAAATLRRAIAQLGQFLLLVGLSALAIAGVGVGSGVAAYLAGKTRIIATLKVLGARSPMIARIFLTQLGIVAAVGILAGLALGAVVPWIVAAVAGDALPIPPRLALYPLPLATAAALALLIALLFALPPFARARAVPAATLLRGVVGLRARPSVRLAAAMASIVAALVALAILSASDRKLAAEFVAATAGLIVLLWLLGLAIRLLLARLPRARRPLLRLALANLHRPGAQTDRLVVALGLGFSLFVALAVIDTSLSSELTGAAPARAPRFFAVDLQPEDAATFRKAVQTAAPGARIEAVPSLRGAIRALNGVPVTQLRGLAEHAWALRGDRTLTWSAVVPPRNTVVAGRWWSPDYRGPPLVSIESGVADSLGLKVGDGITISVLGVDVPARVASLRRVNWTGLGLNFAIIFSPGYIEEAPHALLATVYAPPARDGALARTVAAALPSVTMVRVGDLLGKVSELLGQIALAVRVAATVTVAAGIAVLVGAVAAAAGARRYDAVILKLVGARRAQVLGVQAIEYALLSLVLAGVALAVGAGAGWYVVVRIFALPWAPDWRVVALTLGATVVVTLGIGVGGSIGVLRTRPAEALRDG